ncbi:MAG: PaaI family thioesterase [Spirochaetaceae bacterium]|nr:PaaI family thioesterase [Spirochaetaceae bacterium]
MDRDTESDAQCFCCGERNEQGLHIAFDHRQAEAEASFEIPSYFSGWKGIAHGGVLSMLLDEVMAHACLGLAESAVTAEMTVRFVKPVATGTRVRLVGKVAETRGRILSTLGWIYDETGAEAAHATARFIASRQKAVDRAG